MESQVDSANRSCGEYSKTVKKLQAQIKEMQVMLDNEGRDRDECRDQTIKAERKYSKGKPKPLPSPPPNWLSGYGV